MKRVLLAVCLMIGVASFGFAQTKPVAASPKVKKEASVKQATPSAEKKAMPTEKKHHKKKASHKKEAKKD